jgi:hypothetical protein
MSISRIIVGPLSNLGVGTTLKIKLDEDGTVDVDVLWYLVEEEVTESLSGGTIKTLDCQTFGPEVLIL